MITKTNPQTPFGRLTNNKNSAFWTKQKELMAERISDPVLTRTALAIMTGEMKRVPLRYVSSFESYLETAVSLPLGANNCLARKGGRALKADALSLLIEEIYALDPKISLTKLFYELVKRKGHGVIIDIERGGTNPQITFRARGRRIKEVPVSGLKDRLARARARNKIAQSR